MPLLKKDQVNTILKNAPQGSDKKMILDGLIKRGYDIEGVDSNAIRQKLNATQTKPEVESPSLKEQLGTDINNRVDRVENILNNPDTNVVQKGVQVFGQGAGLAANTLEKTVEQIPGVKQVFDKIGDGINWLATSNASPIKYLGDFIGSQQGVEEVVRLYDTDQDFKDSVDAVANAVRLGSDVSGLVSSANFARNVTSKISSAVESKVMAPTIDATKNLTSTIVDNTKSTVDSFGKRFTDPDVSQATKVSLNPKEALAGTGQDIQVNVGGKLKKLSEITPEENIKIQESTAKSLDTFTEQAKKFANDRSTTGGSPVEIVGSRVDKVLDFADRTRQSIGKKMGEIETKYTNELLSIGTKANDAFAELIKSFDNPKFGIDAADSNIVRKLVDDFDNLSKSGSTIGQRLEFVRSWDKYLNDAKDAFGNFKENATANTRIQNAIRILKNETVDAIAIKDKIYKGLRSKYRTYMQLADIGDALLGKDGALGQRIKGAATVKRAIQSNSDAGARQFLTKLKELTGYDAIKEGDLALTAMEAVGDYQGLSLLDIVRGGKTGLVNKGIDFIQEKLIGTNAERVQNFIKKSTKDKQTTPPNKINRVSPKSKVQPPKRSVMDMLKSERGFVRLPDTGKVVKAIDEATKREINGVLKYLNQDAKLFIESKSLEADLMRLAEKFEISLDQPIPKIKAALSRLLEKTKTK